MFLKSSFLLFLMLAVTGLYATRSSETPNKVCHIEPNLSGDWSFTADVLYWYAAEQTGTDWAISTLNNTAVATSAINELNFPWSWGARVGVGYDTHYDNWTTQLLYTWFETTGRNSPQHTTSISSAYEGPALGNPGTTFQSASIKWDLFFNMFDLDLCRRFYASQAISFRPSLGIKGGWINQNVYTNWATTGLTASENLRNDFWGIGPKGGVEGKWGLGRCSGISLFAMGEGAYLWGRWTTKDVYRSSTPNRSGVILPTNHFGGVMLRGQMGLGWDALFNKDRSQFSARLSYEGQLWFDQIQVFSYLIGLMHQDLTLQGVTLDLRIDY